MMEFHKFHTFTPLEVQRPPKNEEISKNMVAG
jgi:hypothetical protein